MVRQNHRKNWAVPVLTVICLVCVAGMVTALLLTSRPVQGTFTPPPFEEAAVTGTPQVSEELGWQELDAQAFRSQLEAGVEIADGYGAGGMDVVCQDDGFITAVKVVAGL